MKKGTKGISRREFIRGAAAGAVGMAAMGLLGGCSSSAADTQAAGTTRDTGTNAGDETTTLSATSISESTSAAADSIPVVSDSDIPSWLGTEPEYNDIEETYDYDVVVVGSGSAGWPAALTAVENGAKTLLVERLSSLFSPKDDIGAINSRYQQETEKDFPQFAIDKNEALKDMVRYSGGYIDSNLVNIWAADSGEMIDWYADILEASGKIEMWHEGGIGVEGGRDKAYATGHSPKYLDSEYTSAAALEEYGSQIGLEYMLETTFLKCVKEDDRVTGIIAEDSSGKHIQINASKGVIICTGGYSANEEMMLALQPHIMRLKTTVSMGSADNGSGIKAAIWAGAKFEDTKLSLLFNRTCMKPDEVAGYETQGKWFWFGEQPFLKVNLNGERFCSESGPYDFLSHSALLQPYSTHCTIWDSDCREQIRQMEMVGCCRLYPFDNGADSNISIDVVLERMNQELIDTGYIQVADTFEELAEKLNIPSETFAATVEHYNEMAANGVDEDYGKPAYRLLALNTPPYYGVRNAAWHLCTFDGIRIDTNMNAIDETNTPIPGLYICGDASGGFFANSYPNLFTGLACGRSMTFGRRAGRIAAAAEI